MTVVTQRTKRDEIYGYRATLDLCLQNDVPVLTPKSFDEEFLSSVEQLAPELIICAYYPKIFPQRLISTFRSSAASTSIPAFCPSIAARFRPLG